MLGDGCGRARSIFRCQTGTNGTWTASSHGVGSHRDPPKTVLEANPAVADFSSTQIARDATEAVIHAQRSRDRIGSLIEQARHFRNTLKEWSIRAAVRAHDAPQMPWVLLVASRAERRRQLLLRLLDHGFNVDWASSALEAAWMGSVRHWAVVVVDYAGDPGATALLRAMRSVEPLVNLPIVVAHDGVVSPDVSACCPAIVGNQVDEDIASVVWSVLGGADRG